MNEIDIKKEFLKSDIVKSIFSIRTIEQVKEDVKNQPPPKRMIGDLIYESEQIILFSATNLGKSIFASQIAVSIAKGIDLELGPNIVLVNESPPTNTIYYDFELSDHQFVKRIGELESPDNLFIAKIERGEILQGSPKQIFQIIKEGAESVQARFIIIDNISKIGNQLEDGDRAVEFMSALFDLCRNHNYTILIMAHTPKRDKKNPITSDSISGSSKISQLCDAIIGINEVESKDRNTKVYIKQIKSRNGARIYGEHNVICTEINKNEYGYVEHQAFNLCSEYEAISDESSNMNTKNKTVARYVYENVSFKKIGESEGISAVAVKKRIDTFKIKDPEGYQNLQRMGKDDREGLYNIFNENDKKNATKDKKR